MESVTTFRVTKTTLDPLALKVLCSLQDDPSLTIRQLAERFGVSTTKIHKRMKQLVETGVMERRIHVDCRLLGYREMVLASLRVNSKHSLADVRRRIEEMDDVKYAYLVTGEYPVFVMAKCLDHRDAMTLIDKLRDLPGVEEVVTQLVLDRIKEDTRIKVPEVEGGLDVAQFVPPSPELGGGNGEVDEDWEGD
ncbi:MAG: Lrp/AsnC family transcriptional regulator [Promethearchaeota archaeon]